MRYGVCSGIENPERVAAAAAAGFDYIECGFCSLSRGEDETVNAFARALEKSGIACEAANGFLPRDLAIIDRPENREPIRAYIEKGMERGAKLGLKTVVFGSSAARRVPEGFDFGEGFCQLCEFLRGTASPIAEKYGITLVIEPLRIAECNIINTVKEGVMLAAASGCANVHGLADLYHMVCEGDTCEDIRDLQGRIRHAHISNPAGDGKLNRVYPLGRDEYDYKGFIGALTDAGCPRCSVEAGLRDYVTEYPAAAALLKSL